MDTTTNSVSSVQQRTPTKTNKPKKKNKNKPIKVVYISNPMRVNASASEFRALVQELTGQDAESPPDPSRFGGDGGGLYGGHKIGFDKGCVKEIGHGHDENDHTLVMPSDVDTNSLQAHKTAGVSLENFDQFDDDIFTPQMKESISAFLPDSVLYECAQVDHQMSMQCNSIHQ